MRAKRNLLAIGGILIILLAGVANAGGVEPKPTAQLGRGPLDLLPSAPPGPLPPTPMTISPLAVKPATLGCTKPGQNNEQQSCSRSGSPEPYTRPIIYYCATVANCPGWNATHGRVTINTRLLGNYPNYSGYCDFINGAPTVCSGWGTVRGTASISGNQPSGNPTSWWAVEVSM